MYGFGGSSKRIAVMAAELEAVLAEPVDGSTSERTAVAVTGRCLFVAARR